MAKKPQKLIPLTLTEIILRGDAETIQKALEARTQIDSLLEEREAAYQRIAELETQVCEVVGEDGVFPFPEPPMPVATFAAPAAKKKAKPAPKPEAKDEATAPAPADKQDKPAEAPAGEKDKPGKASNEDTAKSDDA